ncbi:retrovirus-related Pol polyprotein from transposon 17.6 [Trichonephila clavipes]|nr:retrovirus-related Pol polyprotein from transposon 17.6 [Trichonephila clavipes]
MNSSPWRSNYTQNPKLSYEHSLSGFPSQSRRETGIPSNSRRNPISKDRIPEKKIVDTKEDRTPVSCYGCGAPGIIRSRCHTCNPVRQKDDALSSSLNQSNFYSFSSESNPISIIQISICNTEAAVCADTGATHSVAGEKLYHLLKQKGLNFEEKTMQMTLADGRTQTTEILTTSVDISIQGKVIPTELLILKNARGNRTLLGINFLTDAGIVLDLQRKQWYFTETSHRKYNFVKAPPNINALLTVDPEPHLCQLRKNEGTHLSLPQREEINSLLEKYEECFQPGGEPTPFIEHRINTRNHLPVAVPPYRMNPSKKEILKQEIDRLLSEGIIEECESPYASPVVLIPKPNGTFRLCIDYRKLNEITVADTYPLPRMDDLLHQAKLTPFMSTLDLRAGYHQVKVHVEDQRKKQYDKNRRPVYYSPGDKVWVTLHPISSAKNKKTSKFMPKRDGPYLILTQKSPTSYVIASLANPSEPIATYHISALTPVKDINTSPVAPLRKRGRPRKVTSTSQNQHVPSPSTATTAVSNRTIHPSTRATTTTANYVSSPGRRRIHRGRL